MNDRLPRKLAAILYADVAGYSRLTGVDEDGTHRILRIYLELISACIGEHSGRVVHYAGDAVLADFGTVVDALSCAVAVQQELAERNEELESDRRVQFRIGVNLGDVIIDRKEIYGDGVNVAARLEALAEPGGICISDAVRTAMGRKLDLGYQDMGEREVKNIADPLRVYKVVWGEHREMRSLSQSPEWQSPTPEENKVSIIVIPFSTIGSEESILRLADGLTADIVTDLSRFSELEIIDLNTAAAYKEHSGDVSRLQSKLGVSYLLDGTVQQGGKHMRISAQLTDVASGRSLWRQRWDRPDEDAFAVQTELAERVAASLGSAEASAALTGSEIRKARSRSPASLKAYDYYLLAVEQMGRFSEESFKVAIGHATKAIELDPNFARAYAARARMHFNTTHYGVDYEQAMSAMEADARKAVELDPYGPEARAALAWFYFVRGRNEEAAIQLQSALEANPANITLIKMAAAVFGLSGNPQEGAQLADKVLRLDPLATSGTLNTIKDAYYFARRFDDAVTVISRVPSDARSRGARLLLTLSLALLGRENETRRARTELLAAYPNISAELLLNEGWAFDRERDLQLFLDGFDAAGLPRCASVDELSKSNNPQRLPDCSG